MSPEESQQLSQPLKKREWPGKAESQLETGEVKVYVPWLVSLLTIFRESTFKSKVSHSYPLAPSQEHLF